MRLFLPQTGSASPGPRPAPDVSALSRHSSRLAVYLELARSQRAVLSRIRNAIRAAKETRLEMQLICNKRQKQASCKRQMSRPPMLMTAEREALLRFCFFIAVLHLCRRAQWPGASPVQCELHPQQMFYRRQQEGGARWNK